MDNELDITKLGFNKNLERPVENTNENNAQDQPFFGSHWAPNIRVEKGAIIVKDEFNIDRIIIGQLPS